MKKILIVVAFSIIAINIQAQNPTTGRQPSKLDRKAEKRQRINALLKLEEEGDPAFKKQNIFGIKLSTDGYGLSFEKGKYKSPRKTLLYQFELNEKKSPKEEKTASSQNHLGQTRTLARTNAKVYNTCNKTRRQFLRLHPSAPMRKQSTDERRQVRLPNMFVR